MNKANQLQEYPLFAGLSEAELAQIAPCLSKRTFAKGAYLYHPGNPALNVYLLESGLVRLFFTDSRGQEYILELAGPQAIIGIPMLHQDQNRLLGAAALQPSVLLVLSKQDLFRLAQRFPQLMQNVYRLMDGTLRKMVQFAQMLVTLSVDARLARLLLYLSKLCTDPKHPDEFEMHISQAELAHWLGASRGHLNRALKLLQARGLIRVEGQKFTLLDRPGLQRMTEG
ncbi:MAG: Crp/Fnr family transcriptional regulator [Anaerolineales bacterium]|nr:Crp/Fnr family transcriptional regulator [Anaerolineales bacterium]